MSVTATIRPSKTWLATQLWALDERYLDVLMGAELWQLPDPTQPAVEAKPSSIAVLSLSGVIVPRESMFSRWFGAVALDKVTEQFKALVADPAVAGVVIDWDSPGGSVSGVPEFAAVVREATKVKHIVSVANPMSASASYWVGSQASEFVATPSADVGSLGVYAVHYDYSKQNEKRGIEPTLIKSAGSPLKAEGHPDFPLTDAAKADMQKRIDEVYESFVADVARGRGVDEADVRKNYGAGRSVSAKDALVAGMIDRVSTLDEVVGELSVKLAQPAQPVNPLLGAQANEQVMSNLAALAKMRTVAILS